MDYETYIANIEQFYKNLSKVSIQFLYFLASDLSQPKVRTEFRYMPKQKCYVVDGIQKNGWHIYQESVLKYLVTVMKTIKKKNVTIYNVKIQSKIDGDVNHGDHLTFALLRTKHGEPIVKTHLTVYRELADTFEFDRTEYPCNFTFQPEKIMNIESTYCEKRDGTLSSETLQTTYDPSYSAIVKRFCKAMLGDTSGGKSEYLHKHRDKHYKLYNKSYVNLKGKRMYVQQGGGYNGVTFISDTFVSFLRTKILEPLATLRTDLATCTVIYDELNYFGDGANDFIVVMYDFGESSLQSRSIFYLESTTAFIACYADNRIRSGLSITRVEKETLDRFLHMVAKTIETPTS